MKLSVIIPGYNTKKEWWQRCVRSVARAVSRVGGEIICVDDGSQIPVSGSWFDLPEQSNNQTIEQSNNTPPVIVKVVRLAKNSGLPTARNRGLEVATGAFVTFVDSDDEVLPEVYAKTLGAMDRTEADVGVFGVNVRYEAEKYQVLDMPPDKFYGMLCPEDVRELYRKRLFYYSCNKVFRRAFFDEHQMKFNPLGVPCEDAIFNVGLVVNKAKWVSIPYIGYVYYRYDGTICSNYKPTYVEGTRACTKAWHDYKTSIPNADEIFGTYDETSEEDIVRGQWTNIWRRNSPFTLAEKWRYAVEHKDVLGRPVWMVFLKKMVFMFCRLHFYFKQLRRWHQKRCIVKLGAKVESVNEI